MPNAKNLPNDYDAFVKFAKISHKKSAVSLLTKFSFRYRLAEDFEGIIAPNVGRTLAGYNVIIKVFLAYTAYEGVVKGARKLGLRDISDHTLNASLNPKLAIRLRENIKLISYLTTHPFRLDIRNKVDLFVGGTTDDIVCVAYALRNAFAHGDLTASAVGTSKKKHREDLLDLADGILDYSDELFVKCIHRLR